MCAFDHHECKSKTRTNYEHLRTISEHLRTIQDNLRQFDFLIIKQKLVQILIGNGVCNLVIDIHVCK